MQHNPEQWKGEVCHERWYYVTEQSKIEEQLSELLTMSVHFQYTSP